MMLVDTPGDTTTTDLAMSEGMEVIVQDDRGRQHTGLITFVTDEEDPVYTVLLSCRGKFDEVKVRERAILARLTPTDDL